MRPACSHATTNPSLCGANEMSPSAVSGGVVTSGPTTGCASAAVVTKSVRSRAFIRGSTRRDSPPSIIRLVVTFRGADDHEPMLSVEEAQQRVLGLVTPLGSERIPRADAHGRVLSEDVVAPFDLPE